ncbi:hypothetical protein EYF80_060678 [Liparis tanakae]|uniref:Uncharacterized protein n=1 Tax=Liparis tanakae TaxID=230148 RepID=A0A4Z2EL47_9TELE|nr:hypothetical protein EYF80_060678 [Liparis tanakae]
MLPGGFWVGLGFRGDPAWYPVRRSPWRREPRRGFSLSSHPRLLFFSIGISSLHRRTEERTEERKEVWKEVWKEERTEERKEERKEVWKEERKE